jgi:1-phosphofructokinase
MSDPADVFVFAPDPLLTVTVEAGAEGGDEIHLHAGGQGFWVARMVAALGVPVALGGPFGGETGAVLRQIIAASDITVAAVDTGAANGAYVHDRRDGERAEVATTAPGRLSRHDVDDLYGQAVSLGMDAKVVVLAGPGTWDPPVLPPDVYRRLAADLRRAGRIVVADLSGRPLAEALTGGVSLLKISHEQVLEDQLAGSANPGDLLAAMRTLRELGAEQVVLSRADQPPWALLDGDAVLEVVGPHLEEVDHRGAGDSMTAGLAAGLALGMDTAAALRLAVAAGALNVTRRGLASGDRQAIERLAKHVDLHTRKAAAAGGEGQR